MLGLDQAAFQREMTDPKIRQKIVQDVLEGNRVGVTGTPTVFVNGRRAGNLTPGGLREAIDTELARLGGKNAAPDSGAGTSSAGIGR